MSDKYSADAELTWDDAADIGALWNGNRVLDSLKSSTESNLNEDRSGRVNSLGHLSSKALDPPEVRTTSSSSVMSESNTYSIHPGSSTPTCKSPVPPLPSFTQSPIVSEEMGDHKSVGISSYTDSSSKTGRKARDQKSGTSSSTDWGSWKTSGLTRSEVEYQNRKNAASTIPTDISSIVEVCVKSRADVQNENCPTPSAVTRGREKRLGSARYNKLQEELEEMRRLENKMRGAMNRLHNGVVYERSRGTKGSSSSGASTMCEVVQEYEKYLELYPFKQHELAGSEVLEEHIHTHLMKIKHQIGLVEKYNRALLEKEAKRSRIGGRRKPSKTDTLKNPRLRDYDQNESTEEKQSMPVFKTRIPIPSRMTRGTSYDQFPTTTSSNNFTKYSSDANSKHIKLGKRNRDPPPPAAKLDGSGLRNPVVDNRLPATVEYERWTWPNERQVTTKSSHEAPIGRVKSVHEKVADKSRGKRYNDKDHGHSSGDQDHNGGLTDDEGSQKSSGVTERDCDEMNRTFTKQRPSATDHKLHEEERGRKLNRGTHTDEPEEQSRDKSSGRKTRNPWTLTDNNSKTREQEFPTAEESKPETMHGDAQIPIPSVKTKKSVAFYVPLFCDNCNEPVEPDNNSKGNCYNCQSKFKWFCETKGEDGLYDTKGPLGIQECFKDAWCSGKMQKRSEDLLSSRFERLSDNDKLYLGMLAKQFSGQEATAFLRNKCHFEGDELLERVCKYLEICRNHKEQEFGAMKEPEKRQNLVVTEQEMRERTARLRGESAILMEKRRREEEQCRRAANRLLKNTYDLKVRKCLKVGGGRNIGIFSEVNIFKYR